MNARTTLHGMLGAVALAAAGTAHATLSAGQPVEIAQDHTIATMTFLGSSAAHTGQLYFLGSGTSLSSVDQLAGDTGAPGLGQLLFNNHTSVVGSSVQLDGSFDAGEILHFAYDVIAPASVAHRLYQTTHFAGRFQFKWISSTGSFLVEDLPLQSSDLDYNDAMFHISFASVPAPGCLALLSGASLIARPRRRPASSVLRQPFTGRSSPAGASPTRRGRLRQLTIDHQRSTNHTS